MGVSEVLIAYARRLVGLSDETAMAPGANNNTVICTSGLAPGLLEGVMPAALAVTTPSLPYIGLAMRSGLGVGIPCLPISFVLMTVTICLSYRILE